MMPSLLYRPMRRLDERLEQEICTRYRGGDSSVFLSEEYGVSKTTILKVLDRNNIERRTPSEAAKNRKADNKEKDTIVIPDLANLQPIDKYWLGFLLGNGCGFQPKDEEEVENLDVTVASTEEDKYHLERLKKYFNSKKQIADQKKGEKENGDKVNLKMSSSNLVDYLEHFGIHQKKDGKEKAHPALVESRDFWRGIVDANGSLYQTKDQTCVSLAGSEELCEQFRNYLVSTFDRDYEQTQVKTKEDSFEITVYGNIKANRVIKHLYYNSCMALTRKLIFAMQSNHARFEMRRLKDVSGVSGTGVVADGCVFRNKKVVLAWHASEIKSVVVYDSLEEMFEIHNHEENSYIIWRELDDLPDTD